MDWIEISVQADSESAESVSEVFNRLNARPDGQGGAVTEVSGFDPVGEDHHPVITVRTYLPADEPDTPERQARIEQALWFLGRIHPPEDPGLSNLGQPAVRRLAEADWANAWKASYHPVRVGRHFLIVPSWMRDEVRPSPEEVPVVLDPGMAFGTGLHPSTQLCLRAMEDLVRPGQRVLDAGCGSGILSIGAARLGVASVDAFDIDPIAVRATEENLALNDLEVPVRVFVSDGGPGPQTAAGSLTKGDGISDVACTGDSPGGLHQVWDLILVNILPHVILSLLDRGLHQLLAPGGRMVLAGIIQDREPELEAALAGYRLRVLDRLTQEDWVALVVAPDPVPLRVLPVAHGPGRNLRSDGV